jgi:hypothetical protein
LQNYRTYVLDWGFSAFCVIRKAGIKPDGLCMLSS